MQTTIKKLLADITEVGQAQDCQISGIALDSRKVQEGDAYFAFPGESSDGRHFIAEAIEKGVAVIVVEQEGFLSEEYSVPVITVRNLRKHLSLIGSRFYQYPSRKLQAVGVTGTNGKTSCTHFLAQALLSEMIPCAIIGTIGNGFPGALQETNLTTPDPFTIPAQLAAFVNSGAQAVAMEVSSHALAQGRVAAIEFAIGIFTNLSRDHLDYHESMDAYARVKQRLFMQPDMRYAVINYDDPWGRILLEELPKPVTAITYGVEDEEADIFASEIKQGAKGIRAQVRTPWGSGRLESSLLGRFNLSNLLAVLATLSVMGVSFHDAIAALSKVEGVSGRMQSFTRKKSPLVVVDYAHTPDALEEALSALREHCNARLWCIFGCGGDRDPGKRPLMGEVATRLADQIILTNDNPRGEPQEQIIEQIKSGIKHQSKIEVEYDRAAAIERAISSADKDDIILIAGKGHENYQQIAETKYPFNDADELMKHDYLSANNTK